MGSPVSAYGEPLEPSNVPTGAVSNNTNIDNLAWYDAGGTNPLNVCPYIWNGTAGTIWLHLGAAAFDNTVGNGNTVPIPAQTVWHYDHLRVTKLSLRNASGNDVYLQDQGTNPDKTVVVIGWESQ
jgi:hypothetical protein